MARTVHANFDDLKVRLSIRVLCSQRAILQQPYQTPYIC